MAYIVEDRIRDVSSTTGAGNFVVSGTPPLTYKSFGSVLANGDTFPYSIVSRSFDEWETGIGTWLGSNQFSRSPIRSTNANAAVNFTGATKDVVLSILASRTLTTASLPSVKGAVPVWAGTANAICLDGGSDVDALAFGADNTGSADSASAIQTALNTGRVVYCPDGTYKLNSLVAINTLGSGIIGDGTGQTIFNINSTSNVGIQVASNINYVRLKDFRVTRTGIATSGGNGIEFASTGDVAVTGAVSGTGNVIRLTVASAQTWQTGDHKLVYGFTSGTTEANGIDWVITRIDSTHFELQGSTFVHTYTSGGRVTAYNDYCEVHNIRTDLHYAGVHFGNASYSRASNVDSFNNISHGILMDGNVGQWSLYDFLSEKNGGDGFHFAAAQAGAACAQWRGLQSNANTGYGFYSTDFGALRMQDCFFSTDGNTEVYVNGGNNHYPHCFTNVGTELSSGGNGFYFDSSASASAFLLNNCSATFNNKSGLLVFAASQNVFINGGSFMENGQGSIAGNTYGILAFAASVNITCLGVCSIASGTQTKGLAGNAGTQLLQAIGSHIPTGDISAGGATVFTSGNY